MGYRSDDTRTLDVSNSARAVEGTRWAALPLAARRGKAKRDVACSPLGLWFAAARCAMPRANVPKHSTTPRVGRPLGRTPRVLLRAADMLEPTRRDLRPVVTRAARACPMLRGDGRERGISCAIYDTGTTRPLLLFTGSSPWELPWRSSARSSRGTRQGATRCCNGRKRPADCLFLQCPAACGGVPRHALTAAGGGDVGAA